MKNFYCYRLQNDYPKLVLKTLFIRLLRFLDMKPNNEMASMLQFDYFIFFPEPVTYNRNFNHDHILASM